MGWLITLAVLFVLASIPLGVLVRYDSQGFLVRVIAGFIRFTLIPFPKRKKKTPPQSPEKPKQEQTAPAQKDVQQVSGSEKKGGSVQDFIPIIKVMLEFLNQFWKKLRINRLVLKLILAGDDPCDLALNYGRAWQALANLMPMLEKAFVIGKRDCEVECDFTATETLITAQAELTVRLGQIVWLGAVYGVRLLKELLIFKKKRKGGAVS